MFNAQGLPKLRFHFIYNIEDTSFSLYGQTHYDIKSYLICFKSAPYHSTMVKTAKKLVRKEEKLDNVGFCNGGESVSLESLIPDF